MHDDCLRRLTATLLFCPQIPDKDLDHHARRPVSGAAQDANAETSTSASSSSPETPFESGDEGDENVDESTTKTPPRPGRKHMRRLSTFESPDGLMDLERDTTGGSAR